jgi:hypothetical protein
MIRTIAPTLTLAAVLALAVTVLNGGTALRHADRYTSVEFVEGVTPLLSRAAGSPFTLTVRVGNHEGRGVGYTLAAALTGRSGAALAPPQRTDLTVADGAAHDVPVTYTLPDCAGRVRVDVALVGRAEALHAWLNVQSADPKVTACA